MQRRHLLSAAIGLSLAGTGAFAQPADAIEGHVAPSEIRRLLAEKPEASGFKRTAGGAADALPPTEAEVRKVDTAAGKVTLKHGEIKNLDMPPMTMVFQARDPAMLANVKAGDKVRFTADQVNGAYTVMSIEPVR